MFKFILTILLTLTITDAHPFYTVLHDTVVCNNSDSERHIVRNSGYETVICEWKREINQTMIFLIPPKEVSNVIECEVFDENGSFLCAAPYFVDSDRVIEL